MFRRFLFLSVGALALLVGLGAPGQAHARGMRGGFSHGFHRGFQGRFVPSIPSFRGGFGPRLRRGFFDRRFDRFEDRFGNRFNRGFDRFEDRFEHRFDRSFFDRR